MDKFKKRVKDKDVHNNFMDGIFIQSYKIIDVICTSTLIIVLTLIPIAINDKIEK